MTGTKAPATWSAEEMAALGRLGKQPGFLELAKGLFHDGNA